MAVVRSFAFDVFLLVPERQILLRGISPVKIGARAFDLLIALVERPGEVVTKSELMAVVWPTTTVDEGNLKVNMTRLRRALDDEATAARYIATVSGRGYRFIAPVEVGALDPWEPAYPVTTATAGLFARRRPTAQWQLRRRDWK